AGRNTRCPRCSTILTIPATGITDEAPAPRRSAAIQADEPITRADHRATPEEDFEDDRPRRRIEKSRKGVWIAVAAAGLLLGGGGLGLWLWLRGGISSDFDLVPRDAQGFVTLRVADALDTPSGKKFLDPMGEKQLKELERLEGKLGITRKEIERVTLVYPDFEK